MYTYKLFLYLGGIQKKYIYILLEAWEFLWNLDGLKRFSSSFAKCIFSQKCCLTIATIAVGKCSRGFLSRRLSFPPLFRCGPAPFWLQFNAF